MKKFWMGLISVMVLLTGGLLSACGQNEITIELNETHKEICLNDDSSHEASFTARVYGVDEGLVSVSSSYENIATASVAYNSITGANVITVKGVSEGNAEIIVTSNNDSSVRSVISVTVYSNITSMAQKEEDNTDGKSNMFVLRGQWNTLNSSSILDIKPTAARKNITYRLKNEMVGVNIEGDRLYVSDSFAASSITLIASSDSGIETDVTLSVIDKLDEDTLTMLYSEDLNQAFEPLAGGTIKLVPNIASDINYTGYIRFRFAETAGVDAEPKIFFSGVEDKNNITILRVGTETQNGYTTYTYEVKAAQGREGLNGTFDAYFEVGYTGFNHNVKSKAFKIECYEKVNNMNVYDPSGVSVNKDTIQTIYTSYAFAYGARYSVELLPNSVVNASNKFEIVVNYNTQAGIGNQITKDTLQFYYRNRLGTIVPVTMLDYNGATFISSPDSLPYSSEFYILASDKDVQSQITGVSVIFRSVDNPEVSVETKFNLYRSASNLSFNGDELDVNLSTAQANSVTKILSLEGQTNIEGLYIETQGDGFTASAPVFIDNTTSTVTFSVTFSVNANALGVTRDCSYVIKHRNGLSSERYPVKLFLPLTDASVEYDNSASAVTRRSFEGVLYVIRDGELEVANQNNNGLSDLLIQAGSSVPMQMLSNYTNGNYAEKRVQFRYLDFEDAKDGDGYTVDTFNSLTAQTIFALAKANESRHISMTETTLLTTNNTGHVYAVIYFTGVGTLGQEVTYLRIIKIENYVAPTQFAPSPSYFELYSYDSVSSDDFNETVQNVTIRLSDIALTYNNDVDNFTFSSEQGGAVVSTLGGIIEFDRGYVSISNIVLTPTAISFTVNALTTLGQQGITDHITVSYRNTPLNDNVRRSCVITVRVMNAERVEKVVWENDQEDGLYFEVGDTNSSQLLVFSTQPSTAKNYQLTYIITDENGNSGISDFITITKIGQDGEVSLKANTGIKGYIYVLPSDAINQNRISYYIDGVLTSIESSRIYEFVNSSDFSRAYFINNNGQNIYFSEIVHQIPVVVANGSSEELAYRIYEERELKAIQTDKYYRIMRSMTLDSWAGFEELTGGIFGDNENITITINGSSFVKTNRGLIRDLIFTGNVVGGGFVANRNYGVIRNVTIDVYLDGKVFKASTLTGNEIYMGGITGINEGQIENVKVQGLNIEQSQSSTTGASQYVGGIVGQNLVNGRINNAGFEIYQFTNATNKISGAQYVGGVIGEYAGGSVEYVYIYDYTLTDKTTNFNLVGLTRGALVGYASENVVLTNSFAVVGNFNPVGEVAASLNVRLTGYISYYGQITNESGDYETGYISDFYNGNNNASQNAPSGFVSSGDGFYSYVNGGKAHIRDFYQVEALGSVSDFNIQDKVISGNNYYQALNNNGNAIMFYYGVTSNEYELMTDSEKRDLENLNTISFSLLFGAENADLLVVSSADSSILEISGRNIVVKRLGKTNITIYSRQNFEASKTFEIQVIYAMSALEVRRSGSDARILDNEELNVQKGKSISTTFSFEHAYIRLGTRGNNYKMLENDYELVYTAEPINQGSPVSIEKVGSLNLTYSTTLDSDTTNINAYIKLSDETLNIALKQAFERTFKIVPSNGAIRIGGDISEVSISPSTIGVITITLETAQKGDKLTPSLSLIHGEANEPLNITQQEGNAWIFDEKLQVEIWEHQDNATQTPVRNLYTYRFTVNVSVVEEYKGLISEETHFDLSLASDAQIVSQDVTIKVSRQEFTNVTPINYRITNTLYDEIDGQRRTYYTVDNSTTSVLSPGSSSILKVDINPDYAYYDHLSIEYTGADMVNALKIDFMKLSNEKTGYYIDNSSSTQSIENGLIVYPSNHSELYFKLWANNLINKDLNLTITIKFFDATSSEPITYIRYFLNISYLQEPQVLVDGQSTAILAKGQTAEVRIVVPYDYDVEINSVITENIKSGITLSNVLSESETAGAHTYFYRLTASVNASLEEGSGGAFNIRVTVSREINGVEERKDTYAIVNLVDFKIDADNIKVTNSGTDTFSAPLGRYRTLSFDYPLLPENYVYDTSDSSSVAAYEKIKAGIGQFRENRYFADSDALYYINQQLDSSGNATPLTIDSLIKFHASNGQWISLYEGGRFINAGGYLEFNFEQATNTLSVKGVNQTASASPLEFKLETHVQVGNHFYVYEYNFNIEVKVYSDEDTPLLVDSEEKFYQMATGDAQNYILMKDIYLTNHIPFDTSSIASFDGNGYTIYIDSFNLEPQESSTLSLALFRNISSITTLKNVRVNVQTGGQITVDLANNWAQINVAGFAVSNDGIITNCEVVAFGSNANNRGLNVNVIRGSGTTQTIFLTDSSNWSMQMAGFVITNSGSITNSRVGGNTIAAVGREHTSESGDTIGYEKEEIALNDFYIRGQGDMAGFVLQNSGTIAASFVKNFGMYNESSSSSLATSGFVGSNTGKILTSYAEAVARANDTIARKGSSLSSKLGIIAGFVKNNNGTISDSYSNILISNSEEDQQSYLASGFVYENEGTLENCFSVSQVQSLKFSQMNFSGVDARGNLLANGEYINCYYYSEDNFTSDDTTETSYNTSATRLTALDKEEYFYGFTFNSTEGGLDGIWTTYSTLENKIPRLIEPDTIAFSNRYCVYENSINGEETGIYSLPYSTMFIGGNTQEVQYGSSSNPIIIRTATEFASVTGLSESEYIQQYFSETSVSGTYRLVADIDFSDLLSGDEDTVALPSNKKAFNGRLYGNGFAIKNLSLASSESMLSYGLFASIENVDVREIDTDTRVAINSGIITNVSLEVNQVGNIQANFVGALAGLVRDANIINVKVVNDTDTTVEGLNFVGGVVGMVMGNSKIKNVTVDAPNVIASRFVSNGTEQFNVINASSARDLRTFITDNVGNTLITNTSTNNLVSIINQIDGYSYAGGVAGFVDIYGSGEATIDNYVYQDTLNISDYDISRIRVTTSANIQGQVVGGMFGYIGAHTDLKDIGIVFNDTSSNNVSRIISTKFYAGGLVGQSLGSLIQAYAEYEATTQDAIENNLSSYYFGNAGVERGGLNIFTTKGLDRTYSQVAVGGLIGLANSGKLTVSYSKVNVIDLNANFVGGVIGKVNSKGADVYYVTDGIDDIDTRFYLNEVYATGDVRAKTRSLDEGANDNFAAGGIIGRAEEGSLITLKSVNAANFISLYNYEYDTNYLQDQLRVGDDYSFGAINVYSILGSFPERTQQLTYIEKVTNAGTGESTDVRVSKEFEVGGADVVRFIQSREQLLDENGEAAGATSTLTIGSVKTYFTSYISTSAPEVKIEAFKGADALAEKYENTDVYIHEDFGPHTEVFGIPSISNYQSADTAYSDTYGVFLGSGVWERANWNHTERTLYPKIRFSLAQSYFIYLDAHEESISRFFDETRKTPDIEVLVRGLLADNSEEVGHIDLASYMEKYNLGPIEFFHGKLVGEYSGINVSPVNADAYLVDGWGGERPAIVLDRPLFANVSEGFVVNNVTFKYISRNSSTENTLYGETNSYSGALVNGDITGGNLTAVTMEFYTGVSTGIGNNTIYLNNQSSVGLVASAMHNSVINGLTIYIKDIVNTTDFLNASAMNIGLVAGSVDINSIRTSNYQDINIISALRNDGLGVGTNNAALINANGASNVGGYFGVVADGDFSSTGEEQHGNINISFSKIGTVTYTQQNQNQWRSTNVEENIFNKIIIRDSNATVNVGGYIGNISYINDTAIDSGAGDNGVTLNNTIFQINSNCNINAGGFFGNYSASSQLSLSSISSVNVKAQVIAANLATANLGGLVGISSGAINIQNIYTQFGVSSNENPIEGDFATGYRENLTDNFSFNTINVSGNANIGGLIGHSINSFNYSITKEVYFNSQSESASNFVMAVNAANLNMGGLIGLASGKTTINASAAKIYSSAVLYGQSSKAANLGGIIGGQQAELDISGSGSLSILEFNGQIYTASEANIGGIVANVDIQTGTKLVNINNTAFGGAIKVFNAQNKNLNIGGTIGNITNGINAEYQLVLTNNSNYGDVFTLYGNSFTKHGKLVYGGLVGNGSTLVSGSSIDNNYVLLTLNDQRPQVGDTAYAVFGNITDSVSAIKDTNYYNHAVCMLTDDSAYDAGYMTAYGDSQKLTGGGYQGVKGSVLGIGDQNASLVEAVSARVGFSKTDSNIGTKLNPIHLSSTISRADEGKTKTTFNGITYYYVSVGLETDTQIVESLDNTAIIGDTYSATIELSSSASPIGRMTGYSFISGLTASLNTKFEANKTVDNSGNETNSTQIYGGLVGQMSGGTIYAVGVAGSLNIGGTASVTMGGLVGQMSGGLINESFTDVQMLYRASAGGQAAAMVGKASNSSATTITYSYAVGTVECYNDIHIDAFSIGSVTVRYSYTSANLEWHDYVTAKIVPDEGFVTTFNGATNNTTQTSIFNDKNANGIESTTTAAIIELSGSNGWVQANRFNYGYPTRNFNYLKLSSYWERGDDTASDGEIERGIHTYQYSRVSTVEALNSNTDLTKYYYAVPNAGVWYNVMAKISNKVILRNDLYMDYFATSNSQIDLDGNVIDLDGRGHRIYNYNSSSNASNGGAIFNELQSRSSVINLDILDSTVTGGAVLANSAESATLSNITLSGDFTIDATVAQGVAGGLLASVSGTSRISSVMSNLNVTGNALRYGGIVGESSGTDVSSRVEISYCVNNGPIVVNKMTGGTTIHSISAGGIVGHSDNTKISYSYNTSSVLAHYTATNNSNTSSYGGGIVGSSISNTLIDHCLNSGLVYVGNKAETKSQYAGGIVGFMADTRNSLTNVVRNCVNEGAVHALGVNADFDIRMVGRDVKTDNELKHGTVEGPSYYTWVKFQVIQTTSKNVYAESIGYQDQGIGNIDGNYNSSEDIIADGAALQLGAIAWETNDTYSNTILQYSYRQGVSLQYPANITFRRSVYYRTDQDSNRQIVPTSRDEYNMPTAFYAQKDFDLTYMHNMSSSFDSQTSQLPKYTTYHTFIADAYSIDRHYLLLGSITDAYQYSYHRLTNSFFNNGNLSSFNTCKAEILSPTPESGDNTVTIQIAGQDYYLANSTGDVLMDRINNAIKVEFTVSNLNLPLGISDNYTITTSGNKDIQFVISSITGEDNNITLKILAYCIDEDHALTARDTINVSYEQSVSQIVDLSGCNYSYYVSDDDYPKGTIFINLPDDNESDGYSFRTVGDSGTSAYIPSVITEENGDSRTIYTKQTVYKTTLEGKTIYLTFTHDSNQLQYIRNVILYDENRDESAYFEDNNGVLQLKPGVSIDYENTYALTVGDFANKSIHVDCFIYYTATTYPINVTNTGAEGTIGLYNPTVEDVTISQDNILNTVSKGSINIGSYGTSKVTVEGINNIQRGSTVDKIQDAQTVFVGKVEVLDESYLTDEGHKFEIMLDGNVILDDATIAPNVTINGKEFVSDYNASTGIFSFTYLGILSNDEVLNMEAELNSNLSYTNCTWAWNTETIEEDLYSLTYEINISSGVAPMTFGNFDFDGSTWNGGNLNIDGHQLTANVSGQKLSLSVDSITLTDADSLISVLDGLSLVYDKVSYVFTGPTEMSNALAQYVAFEDKGLWSKKVDGTTNIFNVTKSANQYLLTLTNVDADSVVAELEVEYAYQLIDIDSYEETIKTTILKETIKNTSLLNVTTKAYYDDFTLSKQYNGVDIFEFEKVSTSQKENVYNVKYSEEFKNSLKLTGFDGIDFDIYVGSINNVGYFYGSNYTHSDILATVTAKEGQYVELKTTNLVGDSSNASEKYIAETNNQSFSYSSTNSSYSLEATAYPYFEYNFGIQYVTIEQGGNKTTYEYGVDPKYTNNIGTFNGIITLVIPVKTEIRDENGNLTSTEQRLEEVDFAVNYSGENSGIQGGRITADPSISRDEYVNVENTFEFVDENGTASTISTFTTYAGYLKVFAIERRDGTFRFYYNLIGEFKDSGNIALDADNEYEANSDMSFNLVTYGVEIEFDTSLPEINGVNTKWEGSLDIADENDNQFTQQEINDFTTFNNNELSWKYKPNNSEQLSLSGSITGNVSKAPTILKSGEKSDCPIILNRNINLGAAPAMNIEIQIYGNNHTLSYYSFGASDISGEKYYGLFSTVSSNAVISGISIAGQVKATKANYSSILAYSNGGKIQDVKIYGSVQINNTKSGILSGVVINNALDDSKGYMGTISSYASIKSSLSTDIISGIVNDNLSGVIKGEIAIDGVIIAANGKRGATGKDGSGYATNILTCGYGESGENGNGGEMGGTIHLLSSQSVSLNEISKLTLAGTFAAGRGGNGGAGGTGANGRILQSANISVPYGNMNGGNGGEGGKAGNTGNIYLYSEEDLSKQTDVQNSSTIKAASAAVDGGAGCGGMHGWILPTLARWDEIGHYGLWMYWYYVTVGKFININNLKVGGAGDNNSKATYTIVPLESATGQGDFKVQWCKDKYTWWWHRTYTNYKGYVFYADYFGGLPWEDLSTGPVQQVVLSVVFPDFELTYNGQTINNDTTYNLPTSSDGTNLSNELFAQKDYVYYRNGEAYAYADAPYMKDYTSANAAMFAKACPSFGTAN